MRTFLIRLLQLYRYGVSPMLGSNCRFYPTCSCYAQHAIEQHGSIHGCWLTVRRLVRCHPWNPGGYDPVPPPHRTTHSSSQSSHG